MTLDLINKKLTIDLNKEIWEFEPDSATGKTFLYKVLSQYLSVYPEAPIYIATYDGSNGTVKAEDLQKISMGNYSLILLDRADRYLSDDIVQALLTSDAIVLLDLKNYGKVKDLGADICFIEFNQEKIHIYD